jgi:hypothetical protein
MTDKLTGTRTVDHALDRLRECKRIDEVRDLVNELEQSFYIDELEFTDQDWPRFLASVIGQRNIINESSPVTKEEVELFPHGKLYDRQVYLKQVGGKCGVYACPECGKPGCQYKFSSNSGRCESCGTTVQAAGIWPEERGEKTEVNYWALLERVD